MRSNYKRLGPYIREVDIRNVEDKQENLLGVSTKKIFIESIANTVGTDFTKYKIVKRNQFTYVPDTSRRGDKIGLAMLETHDEALVSQAYTVFEVIDHNELDPEYLMMWFRRPEFDRYARFKSHGSVREIFGWEEMCEVELPIPHIDKQREIVREYNTIVDRIKLKDKLNQKLEETAQAIYKQWFVDFEFPMSKEYAESIAMPDLEGRPYKSTGGKFKYCDKLDVEIPVSFETNDLNTILELIIDHRGKTPTKLGGSWANIGHPAISAKNIKSGSIVQRPTIRYVDDDLYKDWMKVPLKSGDVIMTSEAPMGEVLYVGKNIGYVLSQRLFGLRATQEMGGVYLYYWLQSKVAQRDMEGRASGTTVHGIRQSELRLINILNPGKSLLNKFNDLVRPLLLKKELNGDLNYNLRNMENVLLARVASL